MDPLQFETIAGMSLPLLRGEDHPCPYLPNRTASALYWLGGAPTPTKYQDLMDAGFRRSGDVVYRPACRGCSACVPLRVPVARFVPSRSQRRALRRNTDVEMTVSEPRLDDERFELFLRYQDSQHDGTMITSRAGYEHFLVAGFAGAVEMSYRVAGRLVGVGIVDMTDRALSSVYFYFDPNERRRSLGVYSILQEIELCRSRSLSHWYAGFYVADCRKMTYKADYRPHEFLHADGVWREWHPASANNVSAADNDTTNE